MHGQNLIIECSNKFFKVLHMAPLNCFVKSTFVDYRIKQNQKNINVNKNKTLSCTKKKQKYFCAKNNTLTSNLVMYEHIFNKIKIN